MLFNNLGENARIFVEFSKQNKQSRFMATFDANELFFDNPNNTIQGFVVNMKCLQFDGIHHEQSITYRDNTLWLFIDDNINTNIDEALVIFGYNKLLCTPTFEHWIK